MINQWFPYRKVAESARVRLFCFAHAGGAASVYREWQAKLPAHIEVCAVQLPGRESRLMQTPIRSMDRLMDESAPVITPLLDRPFALFGYSLGAAVAFQTARRIARDTGSQPAALFVCARRAPQVQSHFEAIHRLPEPEFKEKLRQLGGTPEEALSNAELFELIMPILRADFELNDSYVAAVDRDGLVAEKLNCPIHAYAGSGDLEVSVTDVDAWKSCTTGPFSMRVFQGTHFFLKGNLATILADVGQELTQV